MVAQHTNRITIPPASCRPSHEVMAEVCEEPGRKAVAAEWGVSPALVHKMCEPVADGGSGCRNPLDRLAALMRLTGNPAPLEWLAAQIGYYIVPAPLPVQDVSRCVNVAARSVTVELVETLDVFVQASSDGVICQAEARAIRTQWQESAGAVESAVVASERGMFAGEAVRS